MDEEAVKEPAKLPEEVAKVRWKNLSIVLKIAVIGGFLSIILFLFGFIDGLFF